MYFVFVVFLVLLGLLAGFLSGLLGIGGGLIFTPILFYLFKSGGVSNPVTFTIATSLFCTILVSGTSSYKHIKLGNFNRKESLYVGLFGIIGTFIGKQITTSSYYSETEFSLFFMGILLYTAYSFLKTPKLNFDTTKKEVREIKPKDGFLVGGMGGLIAAMAGLGGGIVMVPFLNLIYHKPFHQTVSITSFAILIIAISAVFQFSLSNVPTNAISSLQLGYVDFGTALPLAIGGVVGASQGVRFTLSVNKVFLQKLFAYLAIIEAIHLFSNLIIKN